MATEPTSQAAGDVFQRFARGIARAAGSLWVFGLAVVVIAAWLITRPRDGFEHTWQLVLNSIPTLVTFLMVFVIQATQNRNNRALQSKLDELIRVGRGAHRSLIDIEESSEEELEEAEEESKQARSQPDTGDDGG